MTDPNHKCGRCSTDRHCKGCGVVLKPDYQHDYCNDCYCERMN